MTQNPGQLTLETTNPNNDHVELFDVIAHSVVVVIDIRANLLDMLQELTDLIFKFGHTPSKEDLIILFFAGSNTMLSHSWSTTQYGELSTSPSTKSAAALR